MYHTFGLAFSPLPLPLLQGAGRIRKVSLPSGSQPVCPGCLTALCTGLRILLDQKWNSSVYTTNEPLQAILPAFTVPAKNFRPLQPLRRYGRRWGSDSHLRTLQLSLPISKRIGYLYLSQVLRQYKEMEFVSIQTNRRGNHNYQFLLLGSAIRLIHPFRGFTGNQRICHPVTG